MTDFLQYKLGVDDHDIELSTSEENLAACVSLCTQARQSIDILTLSLDPRIFNQTACIDALKSFVLNNSDTRVRILIKNPDQTLRSGHRLISLARHLSSYFEIRVIHASYAGSPDVFLLADQRGMLHLPEGDRYEGICNFDAPGQATELSHRFTEIWNHSAEIAEFRQLVI